MKCQVCGYEDGEKLIEHIIEDVEEDICFTCWDWCGEVYENFN